MFKKIAIPFVLLVGFVSMAFYSLDSKEMLKVEEGEYTPIVVLELFTSQGCSSCPPADVLLDKVKKEHPNSVFALSYHVDYWNYIGWEDPFSDSKFSKKQREYNTKFRYSSNYTPEMVVNGREHFVGSNSSALNSKIQQYQGIKALNSIDISAVKREGAKVQFQYELEGDITGKLLRTVLVLDERTTVVKRGENRNRTLKNSNIVVQENYLDLSNSHGKGIIQIPSWVKPNEKLQLMVLVENTALDITGAAKKAL